MNDIKVAESGSVVIIPNQHWEEKPVYIKKIKIEERIPISGVPTCTRYK